MHSGKWLVFAVAILGVGAATAQTPFVSPNGIINAVGDRDIAPAAPGSLISIYGSDLAPVLAAGTVGADNNLPLVLAGTSVTIDGRRAPLLFVSPGQINAQVPFETAPGDRDLVVTAGSAASSSVRLRVSASAPGLFPGAILRNSDYSVITASNPARTGDTLLVYCTGLGAVNPPGHSGRTAPDSPLSVPVSGVSVTVGGRDAHVYYAALSPGFVGLYQVAFALPDRVGPGTVEVTVSQPGAASNVLPVNVRKSRTRYAWQLFRVGSLSAATIAVSDLNRDGLPDLVTSSGTGAISILQSDGKGGFAPETRIDAGFSVRQVLVCDVNGDNRPDLLYRGSDATMVYIALMRQDGGFAPATSWPAGLAISEMRVADINGDGIPDLALSHGDSGQTSVALGNGNGGFAGPARYVTPSGQILAADFNGDGFADVLAVSYSQFFLLAGTRSGALRAARRFIAPGEVRRVESADLNRDGRADIVMLTGMGRTLAVLTGRADGDFDLVQSIRLDPRTGADAVLGLGDVDGDGRVDIAVPRAGSQQIGILYGNGDGSVRDPIWLGYPGPSLNVALLVLDLDGDGAADLVNAGDMGVAVLWGIGGGAFPEYRTASYPLSPVHNAAVADLNRDGSPDVLVVGPLPGAPGFDGITALLNRGDGSLKPAETATGTEIGQLLAVRDFTGDGFPDVCVTRDQVVEIWANGGAGRFSLLWRSPGSAAAAALADFNRDGAPDLVTWNPPSRTALLYLNDGRGAFAVRSLDTVPNLLRVIPADVDGDGATDLFLTSRDGPYMAFGSADGTFQSFAYRPDLVGSGYLLDVNGDGKVDWIGSEGGIGLGSGAGDFKQILQRLPSFEGGACTLADADGDGVADLMSFASHGLLLYPGRLNAPFADPVIYWLNGHEFVAAVDINGDGKIDIVSGGGAGIEILVHP